MQIWKRTISVFLVLTMVLTMLPVFALAEETEQPAQEETLTQEQPPQEETVIEEQPSQEETVTDEQPAQEEVTETEDEQEPADEESENVQTEELLEKSEEEFLSLELVEGLTDLAGVPMLLSADMHLSEAGKQFIKKNEGCVLTAYWDVNAYSIGYGHHGSDVYSGMTITQAQADAYFESDIVRFENAVNNLAEDCGVVLNQYQFDALTDFTYNEGANVFNKYDSTIERYLREGWQNHTQDEWIAAFCLFDKTNSGLQARHTRQAKLFYSGDYGTGISGSNNAVNSTVYYANYGGVDYTQQTSDPQRIAALDKAKRMVTICWTAPCDFPTWVSSENTYNSTVDINGVRSSNKFQQGHTYQGIPYSMGNKTAAGNRRYDEIAWKNLVDSGAMTTDYMSGHFYSSSNLTNIRGVDCSAFVSLALNAPDENTTGMRDNGNYYVVPGSSKTERLNNMIPGDIFLKDGHVMLYAGKTSNGRYAVFESSFNDSKSRYTDFSASELSAYECYRYIGFDDGEQITREIDTRFSAVTPFAAYAVSTGKITLYRANGTAYATSVRNIDGANDECTILEVYTDGFCKVKYQSTTSTTGYRTELAKIEAFIPGIGSFTEWTADAQYTAYRRSSADATIGKVYANDACKIIGTENGRTMLFYPTSSGYKLGWCEIAVETAALNQKSTVNLIWPAKTSKRMINALYYYSTGAEHSCHYSNTHGIDIGSNFQSDVEIVAAAKGVVKTATYSTTSGFGNYVVIGHEDGTDTWYCHLKSYSVKVGQTVEQGQTIGIMGNTSAKYNIGIHLHFEWSGGDPWKTFFMSDTNTIYEKNCYSNNNSFNSDKTVCNLLDSSYKLNSSGYYVYNATPTSPTPLPAWSLMQGKPIVAMAPSKISIASNQYISAYDLCIIRDFNAENGQCTVVYPSGGNNVFSSTQRTVTMNLTNMVAYNADFATQHLTATKSYDVYPLSDMDAHGHTWALDPGDEFYTINRVGNATEVLYYCSRGAHAGYWKLGWIYLDYCYLDLNCVVDGTAYGTISECGTVDMILNGESYGKNITDFYMEVPYGSTYRFENLRCTDATYKGVKEGSLEGQVTGKTDVVLEFTRNNPCEISTSVQKNMLTVSWNYVPWATVYNVRIFKDTNYTGTEYSQWGVTDNSCKVQLPLGHYYVYVDSCTTSVAKQSNIVELDITECEVPITITPTIPGAAQAGISVTAPEGGWKEGTNTFTVACAKPCVVAVSYDGGQTYVRLTASDAAGGKSFTAENMTADTQLVVQLSGDTNGDGKINVVDANLIRRHAAQIALLNDTQKLAADVNGDGKVNVVDANLIRRYAAKIIDSFNTAG